MMKQSKKNGGIHVVQTFFCSDLGEEIQIKGRTARQGQEGSFQLILRYADPQRYGITEENVDQFRNTQLSLYKEMVKLRHTIYEKEATKLIDQISKVKGIHNVSTDFIRLISQTNVEIKKAAELLKTINPPISISKDYHVVFVLDASGSMGTKVKSNQPNETRWTALMGAVDTFINSRRQGNFKDLISIIEYDHRAHLLCQAQSLSTDFKSKLQLYGGGTDFAIGLNEAKKIFDTNKHDVYTPVLLFLSDGECNNGDNEMKNLFNAHKSNGLQVFVLNFCGDQKRLENLAGICGSQGKFFNSVDGVALEKTFVSIEEQLRPEQGSTN